MVTKLSLAYEHLYFPIYWNASGFNSRALAYLIAKEHSTVARQLVAMFPDLPKGVIHHQIGRVFSVECYYVTKEQMIKYLSKHKNPYQATILKQKEQGVEPKDVVIKNSRFIRY